MARDPRERRRALLTDLAALHGAVLADPTDDDARLVLADALSQRGDPAGERIAVQCALARENITTAPALAASPLDHTDPEYARLAALLRRQAALLHRHETAWLAEAGLEQATFARGFVEELHVVPRTAERVAELATAVGRSPITRLRITHPHPATIAPLAAIPDLARVRALEVTVPDDEPVELPIDARRLLAAMPALAELAIYAREFDPTQLPLHGAITDLALSTRATGALDCVKAMAGAARLRRLAMLAMADDPGPTPLADILDGGLAALAELVYITASPEAAATFARASAPFPPALDLHLDTEVLLRLVGHPKLATVRRLTIRNANFEGAADATAEALATSDHAGALESLELPRADLTYAGVAALARMRAPNLAHLRIKVQRPTSPSIAALVAAHPRLVSLEIDGSFACDDVAAAIAAEPAAARLRTLALRTYHPGDTAFLTVARAPHLAGLRALDLAANIDEATHAEFVATPRPALASLRSAGKNPAYDAHPNLPNLAD